MYVARKRDNAEWCKPGSPWVATTSNVIGAAASVGANGGIIATRKSPATNTENLELKGLRRPVAAFNVVQSTSAADARPNLTVVARGPGV
jgi:hypothetical protein